MQGARVANPNDVAINIHRASAAAVDHAESELALIAAAKEDAKAFGELYTRYVGRVYRYMRGHMHNDEDAADLTQRVFLQALDALPRYRERGLPFAAWLFRIAHNVSSDAYRRRHVTVRWDSLPDSLHPLQPEDCERETLRREDIERLRWLVRQLNPDERELIALRFDADLSLGEIARVVGTSKSTIQRRMVTLLESLKEGYCAQA